MTSESHTHPDKYLDDAWRTVHRSRADCPRGRRFNPTPKRNLAPRFNEWLKGESEIGVYLDRLVAIPDI